MKDELVVHLNCNRVIVGSNWIFPVLQLWLISATCLHE